MGEIEVYGLTCPDNKSDYPQRDVLIIGCYTSRERANQMIKEAQKKYGNRDYEIFRYWEEEEDIRDFINKSPHIDPSDYIKIPQEEADEKYRKSKGRLRRIHHPMVKFPYWYRTINEKKLRKSKKVLYRKLDPARKKKGDISEFF